MQKRLDIVITVLLFILVAVNSGRMLGYDIKTLFSAETETIGELVEVTLDVAKGTFPQADRLQEEREGVSRVLKGEETLGFMFYTAPYTNHINGLLGPTPLLVSLDSESRIMKVDVLPNNETANYGKRAIDGVIHSWNGKTIAEALETQVDGVSGATYTSKALIRTMQTRLATLEQNTASVTSYPVMDMIGDIILALFIIIAMVAYFRPAILGKKRWIILAAGILILGIWQGRLLSMAQFTVWVVNGVPLWGQWAMLVLIAAALLLPIIFGKAFYCTWVCPFGNAQELIGKTTKKKWKMKHSLVSWLQLLRKAILFGGLLTVGIGMSFDFAQYEPFSIFRPQTAAYLALGIGVVSLILSAFIPRPFCRFGCPLGEMLEQVRRKKNNKKIAEEMS